MVAFVQDHPIVRKAALEVQKDFGDLGIVGMAIFDTEPEDQWMLIYLLVPACTTQRTRKSGPPRKRKRRRLHETPPARYVWRPLRYERYNYEGPDSKLMLAGYVGEPESKTGVEETEPPDLEEEHRVELQRNICGVFLLHLRAVCSYFSPGFGNITLAGGLGLEADHALYAKRLRIAYLAGDGIGEEDQLAVDNVDVQQPPPPARYLKPNFEIVFKLLGRALAKRGDLWDIYWCYQEHPSAGLTWVSDLKPNEVLRFSYLYYATSGRGSYRRMIVDYPLFGNFIQGALTPHQADKALEQLAMDLREADEEGSQFSEAGIALDDDSEEDTSDRSSDTGSA